MARSASSRKRFSIVQSVQRYERWLRRHVAVVDKDLRHKRKKIRRDAFVFLRGTFFRWAERIEDVCPSLVDAPAVLAVGDAHLENFGVWRDAEGRLAWGVNDFDEAAPMPYGFDLVRLATSAILAWGDGPRSRAAICAAILQGYRKRLAKPRPFILDEQNAWMRHMAMATDEQRREFWDEIDAMAPAKKPREGAPASYRRRLSAALPGNADIKWFGPRRAGVGSLGRPRFVVVATWEGGRIVREAKALAPSAWTIDHPGSARAARLHDLRPPSIRPADPFFSAAQGIIVRRLAPDSRKLELDGKSAALLQYRVLGAMGGELANIHALTSGAAKAIAKDLARRENIWLTDAARAAVRMTREDFKAWREAKK